MRALSASSLPRHVERGGEASVDACTYTIPRDSTLKSGFNTRKRELVETRTRCYIKRYSRLAQTTFPLVRETTKSWSIGVRVFPGC